MLFCDFAQVTYGYSILLMHVAQCLFKAWSLYILPINRDNSPGFADPNSLKIKPLVVLIKPMLWCRCWK